MTEEIERLIGAEAPDDVGRLDGLEEAVWARIAVRRDSASMGQVRVAAVGLALVLGVANGGLLLLASPRPEPSELRIFTVSAGLSPLGPLDARG